MKAISTLLLTGVLPLHAAVYVMDFSGAGAGTPVDGLDGWVQSEANYEDIEVYPRSFVSSLDSSPSLAIGGYYDTEDPTNYNGEDPRSITIGREVSGVGLNRSDLQLNFAITDSSSFDVDRNSFTVGYFNPVGVELFSLVFRPGSQSADPENETALWNVHWLSGGNLSAAFAAVIEGSAALGGIYSLSLVTNELSGGDVGFQVSVSGANSFHQQGTLTGLAGEDIAEVRIGWHSDEGETLGSNFLEVGSMVVSVPEPSAALLLFSALMPALVRRRRDG